MRNLNPPTRWLYRAVSVGLALCLATQLIANGQATHPIRTPVLVELFTSEGCSSCPPADALLAKLLQQQPVPNADIIVLEEHVDYWESLGWHDRFSSRQFTDRQTGYAHALNIEGDYTPQMVVDGTAQFVGNDSEQAIRAITKAAHTPKLPIAFSALALNGSHLTGTLTISSSASLPKADLYAALIEPNASTKVLHGENSGRTLNHVSVARALTRIAALDPHSPNQIPFALDIPSGLAPSSLRLVVFVQRSGQGSVAAISSAPLDGPQSSVKSLLTQNSD